MNGDRCQILLDRCKRGPDLPDLQGLAAVVQELIYAIKTLEEQNHRLKDKIRSMGASQ